jgi:hypothetical protein
MGGEMKYRGLTQRGTFFFAAVALGLGLWDMFALASAEPGRAPTSPVARLYPPGETTSGKFFSATGKLFLSVDGTSNDVSYCGSGKA